MSPIHIQRARRCDIFFCKKTKERDRPQGRNEDQSVALFGVRKSEKKAQKWKDRRTPMRHATDRMYREAR